MFAAIVAQALSAQIMAAPADMSPEARIAIAPVAAAIAEVRKAQAALPPPKDDVETLLRMRDLDQAAHRALGRIDVSRIPPADRKAALTAIQQQVDPVDRANQQALLAMLPPEGWFTISRYGKDASNAAFLIIQHAGPDLQRRFLPVLEPFAAKGEVAGGDYALMFDRLALSEGRKQRYGTQIRCEAGKLTPSPIEDPQLVDSRRAAVGLGPYADYLAGVANAPPCG